MTVGQYRAAGITLTDGQVAKLQFDSSGNLKTTGAGGGGGAVTIADGAAVTIGAVGDSAYAGSGTASLVAAAKGIYAVCAAATPAGTNLIGKVGIDQTTVGTTNAVSVAQLGTGTINTGNGTAGTGTLRVSVASDSTGQIIALGNVAAGATDSGNPVKAGGVYNSTLPTYTTGQRGDVQLNAKGLLRIAINDASGTTMAGVINTGQDGVNNGLLNGLTTFGFNSLYNGSTWDRQKKPASTSRIVSSAATTNGTSAKASAGDVFVILATNTTASLKYIKFYNKASAPTVGTDTPVLTIPLQPSNVPTRVDFSNGLYFSTGIAYALTGAAADADTTALASGDVVGVNVVYQ